MRVLGVLAPQAEDSQPPTVPTNLVATAINAGRIDLTWTASTDNIAVLGYQIFRNGLPLNTTSALNYSDTTCQPSTLYSYVVVAFDGAGNSSAQSLAATATTQANAAPVWQSIPAQTLIVGNAYQLQLSDYCSDSDLDTLTFSVASGTLPSGVVLSANHLQGTPSTAGQIPTVTVRASDPFHQIDTTIAFHTYNADVTAPSVPAPTATANGSSEIDLSWSAVTDTGPANEFVSGTKDYRVYRSTDGVTYSLRATVTSASYSDTGLSSATQYWYKVTSRDQLNNESAQSSAVTATTVSVSAVKWNPGYYVLQTSISSYSSANIVEIGAIANARGWKQMVGWSTIETARNVYDWTFTDTLLQLCKNNGKRLVIEISSQSYNNTNPLPAYLATEPNGGGGWYAKVNTLGVQSKVYLAAIMDRLIALAQAIASRYDTDSKFEGIIFQGESSLPEATLQGDYSESSWLTQYQRMVQAGPAAFAHTNFWMGLNFGFSNLNSFATILATMNQNRCGMTAPDVYISSSDNTANADRALRGLQWNGTAWVAGGTDYRGLINVAHDWQGPELGGKENPAAGTSMSTLYAQAFNTHKDNHSFILYKNFQIAPNPPTDIYWDNTKSYAVSPVVGSQDIKTFISSGSSPTRTAAPSGYTSVVTGG
jgi:chitodextrinase